MIRASQILSRAAALTLAAAAVAVVIFGLALPFAGRLAALDEDRRIAAAAIDRLSARVRDRDSFAARLADIETEVAQSQAHIQADTTALGAAVMQQLLSEAAARHGVNLESTQVLPSATEAGLQRIALRADVAGPFPGIAALLHALESGLPYMFIEALEMRTTPGMAADGSADPELSVRLDVAAYMSGPEG